MKVQCYRTCLSLSVTRFPCAHTQLLLVVYSLVHTNARARSRVSRVSLVDDIERGPGVHGGCGRPVAVHAVTCALHVVLMQYVLSSYWAVLRAVADELCSVFRACWNTGSGSRLVCILLCVYIFMFVCMHACCAFEVTLLDSLRL